MEREFYQTRAEDSHGRLIPEPESAIRSPFQRDRDRIIHCAAFRRLEYKTQVLVNFEGDHFRTRLTHSLEVAQIARTLARSLGGNEDLAEAIALAHDLGHPPFGHAGETVLDDLLKDHGGFDHNIQAFRIVTSLERKYAGFDGLNLSAETLDGLVKHGGAMCNPPALFEDHPLLARFKLNDPGSLEAQIAGIADDIAYCAHDLDDGLRGQFFDLDTIGSVPMIQAMLDAVDQAYGSIEPYRRQHEMVRRVIDYLVTDLIRTSTGLMTRAHEAGTTNLRSLEAPVVRLSDPVTREMTDLRNFLKRRMYRHYKVNRMSLKAKRIIEDLFRTFCDEPQCLPDAWHVRIEGDNSRNVAGTVRDYIAGMTDRYAFDEHERLFQLRRYTP